MTLFESDSQYREKAVIWRIFSLLPLYEALASGRVWRWFAVNIPMDLGTGGGRFTSDIDIIARLHDYPRSREWLYKTWEVKVALLCRDGSARSLKAGKVNRLMTQLTAYREFGSPDVSLLDVYLCETGFLKRNPFPTPELLDVLIPKVTALKEKGFGYHILPFEHGRDEDGDIGLFMPGQPMPKQNADITPSTQPFSRLTDDLDAFFERCTHPKKSFRQIVFCRICRRLQLIKMKEEYSCPSCESDLIEQF